MLLFDVKVLKGPRYLNSEGSGRYPKSEFWVLDVPWRNGFKARWTRFFFSFFAKFLTYLMIFPNGAHKN